MVLLRLFYERHKEWYVDVVRENRGVAKDIALPQTRRLAFDGPGGRHSRYRRCRLWMISNLKDSRFTDRT
jgi:hypothetical protein